MVSGKRVKCVNSLSSEKIRVGAAQPRHRLTQAIQTHLLKQDFNITPLVDVNVLKTLATSQ